MDAEDRWGVYQAANQGKDTLVVTFAKRNESIAIYTVGFLQDGIAYYQAHRTMVHIDFNSHILPISIGLNMGELERKLDNMQIGKSEEKEFLKYLEEKKLN